MKVKLKDRGDSRAAPCEAPCFLLCVCPVRCGRFGWGYIVQGARKTESDSDHAEQTEILVDDAD